MAQSESRQSGQAPAIPSLPRQRLADQIADVLREQMLTGALKPGDAIHERETAEALGVSRTPLREAILILEAEGLVETSPARSPIVAAPTLEELTQMLTVLATLEGLAGELACKAAQPADLTRIRQHLAVMEETQDSPDTVAFFRTDMAFHQAIVAASGNQPLIKTHRQYNSRLWRARYMSASRKLARGQVMADHHEIFDGLTERDPRKTSRALRRHLDTAITNITLILQTEGQPPSA
jgi:DNA-binding GntR family transcriptional regulator